MSDLQSLFFRHVAQTSPEPLALHIVSADGCYLNDAEGKAYLDMISGISVSSVGHHHPAVINAVTEQLNRHTHLMVYGEFIQETQTRLAAELAKRLPGSIDAVYFVNSGAEAIEGALKLSKRFTGRFRMLSFENAYHGSTHGALSMMGSEEYKNSFRPLLPGVSHLRYNCFEDLDEITSEVAAVLVEPVQAEAGVILPVKGFLEQLRKKCSETGTLLIFDEVQTGFGRTGTFFASEHSGVVPDIVVMAKALGGGFPLGAFAAKGSLMQALTHQPVLGHITTFGGHPVSCAASLATIGVIEQEKLVERVSAAEKRFESLLQQLPLVKAFRHAGLLMALEFESFEINRRVIQILLKKGVISDWYLFAPHCLRLAPPLVIGDEDIDRVCALIRESTEMCAMELGL